MLISFLFFKIFCGSMFDMFGYKKNLMMLLLVLFVMLFVVVFVVLYEMDFMFESKNGGKFFSFYGCVGFFFNVIGFYFFVFNYFFMYFNFEGGNEGNVWDDGVFDGVSKVVVGWCGKFVSYVSFEYVKGESIVLYSYGESDEVLKEVINFDI